MNIIKKILNFLGDYESFFIGIIIGECFIAMIMINLIFLLGFISSIILAILKLSKFFIKSKENEDNEINEKARVRVKMPTLEWKTKKVKKAKAKG